MDKEKRKLLEERKNRIGLLGTRLEITDDIPGKSFRAHIQTDWRKIRMDFQKELDLVPDEETKRFTEKVNIPDAELKLGEDILEHECGHRENRARTTHGCPYDVFTHDRIKSEVARALKAKGKQAQTDYVTNAFEDILNNINCRNYTDFSGQTLFWNNQGIFTSKNGTYNPFYEAFVRTNLFLGSEVKSHTLLSRFFSKDKKVMPAVKGFLEDLCRETGEESPVRFHQKDGFKALFTHDLEQRRKLWERLGFSFASKMVDLLDTVPQEIMFGSGESSGGNPFDKEMQDPLIKEKIAMDRYNQGRGPSEHEDVQEQLYSFYKATSKAIKMRTTSFSDSQSMPLVHFGKRFVNEQDKKIRYKGIGFNSEGKLGIKTSRHSFDFPASYKRHPTEFPNLKVAIMDRSGSMAQSPEGDQNIGSTRFIPWGDNSKYHFALKGYFGLDNYLERCGVAPFMDCTVLGLSGERSIRGKAKDVAKRLLHKPSGGHTTLNVSQLEEELSDRALVMSISDGCMDNVDDEKTYEQHRQTYAEAKIRHERKEIDDGEFSRAEEIFEKNRWKERFEGKTRASDYVHIQIGGKTAYSEYVQNLGKPVLLVKGDDDLSRAMINFVSAYYHSKGQEIKR